MKYLFISFLILISSIIYSQDELDRQDVIQLSGVLVSGDSLQAVSYANIYNVNTNEGHMSS